MAEPTLLRLARITRVDLVDKGASYDPVTGEGAHVMIHKRAAAPVPDFELPAAWVRKLCAACADRMDGLGVTVLKIGPATPAATLAALGLTDPTLRAGLAAVIKQKGNLGSLEDWAQSTGYEGCVQHLKHHLDEVDNPYAVCHFLVGKRAPVAIAKKIMRREDQYCVTDESGEKTLGCHDTEADAKRQLAAVEANKRAPWWTRWATIAKAALGIAKDGYAMPAKTFEEAFLARTMYEVTNCLGDAFGALYEAIEGAIRSPEVTDKPAAIQAAVEAFNATVQAEVEAWLDGPVAAAGDDVAMSVVGKVGRKIAGSRLTRMKAAHEALGVVIREAEGGEPMADAKKAAPDLSMLAEPVRKYVEGLQAEHAALTATVADLTAKAGKPKDPWEGVAPDVRKRIEDQATEITKLRDQADQTVYVAKAAGFRGLPIKPDDDWKVLKAIDTLGTETAKRIHELLAAGDAAMKLAALRPVGSDAGVPAGDAWGKIEVGAKEMVTKSGGKLTEAQAISKFLETPEGRRLYGEYMAQNPQQAV